MKGRPKSEEKRHAILDAAPRLFIAQGFENTSVEQIAEAAGVSKQTVYSHFQNKEALFAAAITARCHHSHLTADDLLDDTRPCREMLIEIGHRFASLLTSQEVIAMFRIVMNHADQHPQISRLFYESGPLPTCNAVAGYLARQHALGNLVVTHPARAAKQLMSLLKGEYHLEYLLNLDNKPRLDEIDGYIQHSVDLFLKAHARTPSQDAD